MKWRCAEAGDHRAEDGGYSLRVWRDGKAWGAVVHGPDGVFSGIHPRRLLTQAKRAAEDAVSALRADGETPIGWVRL